MRVGDYVLPGVGSHAHDNGFRKQIGRIIDQRGTRFIVEWNVKHKNFEFDDTKSKTSESDDALIPAKEHNVIKLLKQVDSLPNK